MATDGRGIINPAAGPEKDPSSMVIDSAKDSESSTNGESRKKRKPRPVKTRPCLLDTNESITRAGERSPLPNKLVEMWTHIDPDLQGPTIAQIIQETYATYQDHQPPSAQPWMRMISEQAAGGASTSTVAVEKARIAAGGLVPAAWAEAAGSVRHGRKWLAVAEQQQDAGDAARQADEARAQVEEARRRAAEAQRQARRADEMVKEALEWMRKTTSAAVAARRRSRAALAGWEGDDVEVKAEAGQGEVRPKAPRPSRKRKAVGDDPCFSQ